MDNVIGDNLGGLKIGFEMNGKTIRIADILPSRKPDEKLQSSRKYATVVASIREVGIIEPPVVHPMGNGPGTKYLPSMGTCVLRRSRRSVGTRSSA